MRKRTLLNGVATLVLGGAFLLLPPNAAAGNSSFFYCLICYDEGCPSGTLQQQYCNSECQEPANLDCTEIQGQVEYWCEDLYPEAESIWSCGEGIGG